MSDDIQSFAGVDWTSETHQLVLVDALGVVTGERTLPHSNEGLGIPCDWLLTTTGSPTATIAAAIEVPHARWPRR